jgi:hypothetical protein
VLSTFQEARHFTPRSAARYERLAASAALVGALGVGLPTEPAPGVRGAALDASDALAGYLRASRPPAEAPSASSRSNFLSLESLGSSRSGR